MTKVLVLVAAIYLSGCSLVPNILKSATGADKGVQVDAQIGSNKDKVNTGVGHLGTDANSSLSAGDAQGDVNMSTSSGKYHIESAQGVNVVVEETNSLVYYLMGFFFILTLVREFFSWRKRSDK